MILNDRPYRSAMTGVALALALIATLTACGSNTTTDSKATAPIATHTIDAAKVVALDGAMREQWANHMQWTWSTVDAFFHNQAGLKSQLDRLLQNQKDLGAAIAPYYGQDAATQLTALLTTHIQDAVPVLTAAKAGDNAALKKGLAAWYANAKDIADFLAKANPDHWPTSATEPMMKAHIDPTTAYAVDLLKGNYAQAVKDYDVAFSHMMMLADTLASGIEAQFPTKF